ncbi:Hypothetical protein NTJ_04658 [Nesidiocoris tenuis]|uniref:Uncharacterized protein n=1 Tax=Nesidiocoris tenuis TaxID=355587 RepID=A0ABN7AHV8_9HEMI|nr:Hypothetical protein NTJ_04658 [Nesidiocoris tenuis]
MSATTSPIPGSTVAKLRPTEGETRAAQRVIKGHLHIRRPPTERRAEAPVNSSCLVCKQKGKPLFLFALDGCGDCQRRRGRGNASRTPQKLFSLGFAQIDDINAIACDNILVPGVHRRICGEMETAYNVGCQKGRLKFNQNSSLR